LPATHKLNAVVHFRVPMIYSSLGWVATCCVTTYVVHIQHVQLPLIYADNRGRVDSSLTSYSKGPGFKSKPGDPSIVTQVFRCLPGPSRKFRNRTSNQPRQFLSTHFPLHSAIMLSPYAI
jgi:hypothetical protein